MLQERIGGEPLSVFFAAYKWDNASAEVKGKTTGISDNFRRIWIFDSFHRIEALPKRAYLCLWSIEELHESLDLYWLYERFITLHVDNYVSIGIDFLNSLLNSVGTRILSVPLL